MADTARATDTGVGLSLVSGLVALLAALATLGTSYAAIVNDDHGMQVLSGVALAVALLAAGLAVAAVHIFQD
jgi:uncharacterized membrane protein YkgB